MTQGLILGLGVIAYMVKELAERFQEEKDKIHKGLLAFSTFFVIGLEYTGLGVARSQNVPEAVTAYQVSLVITVLVFLGMTYRLVQQMKDEAKDNSSMRKMGDS